MRSVGVSVFTPMQGLAWVPSVTRSQDKND
jgi:hypothetical protein